jgi:hypothetical protein
VDAKLAGFIVGRGDHATTFRCATDNDRLPDKGWIVSLLNRGVKGVHVDMKVH